MRNLPGRWTKIWLMIKRKNENQIGLTMFPNDLPQECKFPLSIDILSKLQLVFTLAVGAFIVAIGYSLFQIPFNLAAGGLTGLSIIIRHFTGWPVGILYLLMNIPLLLLGFRQLGRWRS